MANIINIFPNFTSSINETIKKMDITRAFYDFGVPYISDKKKMQSILNALIKLGYKTIAIEQMYDHTKKDTTKKQSDLFPAPIEIDYGKEYENNLRILHRLTIIYSDVGVSHSMTNSLNLKKYHLIAGLPKTEAALNHCCTTFNGDIICIDPENTKLLLSRKTYQMAVKKGICFEIKYSPTVMNSVYRTEMIKIAHNYHAKGKLRNVIFSSGATNEFELRGPYDVTNLALIFGLSEDQGKSSISTMCRTLYLRAESRRIGKTIMFVKNIGPMVVSSSSSSEESGESETEDNDFENIPKITNDDDDEDENEMSGQPFKRKKLG